MFLELDGNGPSYAQLTRALREAILNRRVLPGALLPSTRALAVELGLSRITVLAAYEQLRAEGYIDGRVGAGSYVSALQTQPARRHSPGKQVSGPPSRYSIRARKEMARTKLIAWRHRGLRFDLQYGNTLTNAALSSAWSRELAHAATFTQPEITHLQGLPALREQVCGYLARRRGVVAHPDDVLIVNGAQQACTLIARVLLNEAAPVVLEDPHYFGIRRALGAHGARLQYVRIDDEGLVCAELPKRAPRLICVTPSHQFPAGPALSLPRRLELLRYAETKRCWIMEDDYDSEFRYGAQPLPALRSLDRNDRVIYVGTFSKVLFGSLRLGYMVLPVALRDDFITAKCLCDLSSPSIEQTALAHFMETGAFERHLRLSAKTLRARRKELIDGLHRHAGERVQIADSHAGMHLVVWLRDYSHAQAEALIEYAHERGLGLYPMAPHYETPPANPGLLLGYGGRSTAELHDAMRLFGECLDVIDAAVAQRSRRTG